MLVWNQAAVVPVTAMKKFTFDPRPAEAQNLRNYTDYVRNVTINYKSFYTDSLPLSQLFAPANPYAIECGHDYVKETLSDTFLSDIHVTNITREEADKIEIETRGQCNNQKWFIERCVRLHASKFGRICQTQDRNKLSTELVQYKKVNAAALEHGRKFEKVAIHEFESLQHVTVQQCGIIVSVERPYLGCCPDGLIGADALLEVKCPFAARNKYINPVTVDYLYLDEHSGLMRLNNRHQYYYQVQGQLYITGRKTCFFVVYTLCD